jgi:hypothetical protein
LEHNATAPRRSLKEEDCRLRERALAEGKVFVSSPAGIEVRDPAPRDYGKCRGPGRRGRRGKKPEVDPFVTTRKIDRPMLNEQRSELRSLCRELRLPYDATLTRGQANRLLPQLRKYAKTLLREQQEQRSKSNPN